MMLYQAFTAADFSCCLFVGLSTFSFVFSKWNACSIRLKSGDWLGHCKIFHFFNLQKLLGCFCCMFWVIVHLYYDALSNQLCAFDWIWAESIYLYTSEWIRLLLSSVTSSLNTSNPVPLEAMHDHAITLLHHVSQMMLYALDHELFQAFSILFSSRHSGTGLSSFQPSNECFSRSGLAFFRCFFGKV